MLSARAKNAFIFSDTLRVFAQVRHTAQACITVPISIRSLWQLQGAANCIEGLATNRQQADAISTSPDALHFPHPAESSLLFPPSRPTFPRIAKQCRRVNIGKSIQYLAFVLFCCTLSSARRAVPRRMSQELQPGKPKAGAVQFPPPARPCGSLSFPETEQRSWPPLTAT